MTLKALSAREGQAFLLVLMVMPVLLVLTLSLGTLIQHQYQNVFKEEYFLRAFNAAETGIEMTIAGIMGEACWYETFPQSGPDGNYTGVFEETAINGGASFEVDAQKQQEDIGISMRIKSVGRYRTGSGETEAQKTLLSTVGTFEAGDYLRGLTVLPHEPANLAFDGNLILDGDLLVNGDAGITGSTEIYGVVYASRGVTETWPGNKYPGYLFIPPFPEIDANYYLNKAETAGNVFHTDMSFKNWDTAAEKTEGAGKVYDTEDGGIYFVNGDITIGGNYRGAALFFATGNITVTESLTPVTGGPDTGAGLPALVAMGDVDIRDHTVFANLLAGGCLRALGGASLHGSACARGVDFRGGASTGVIRIQRQEKQVPLQEFIPLTAKILEWKELYPVF
ncbi:MAG: hypothetical protein MJA84_18225 [Firmicutes bacterium]|nr:hypothetical protein [Bacillota bacterium]